MHWGKIVVFVLGLWLAASAPVWAQESPVLIQGAMDIEVSTLVERLEEPQAVVIDGWTYWQASTGSGFTN